MTDQDDSDGRTDEIRLRILSGLEAVLTHRPFAEIAVSDIVAAAGMSKRSFYQVYPHKAACLVDHADRFHARWVLELEREVHAGPDRLVGAEVALRAFLKQVHDRPLLARAHLVDLYGLGADAVVLRQDLKLRYAAMLQRLAADDGDGGNGGDGGGVVTLVLDEQTALRIIGAIDDVLVTLTFGNVDDAEFERLARATVALVRAVFVGLWVEQAWGPVDLRTLAADGPPDVS